MPAPNSLFDDFVNSVVEATDEVERLRAELEKLETLESNLQIIGNPMDPQSAWNFRPIGKRKSFGEMLIKISADTADNKKATQEELEVALSKLKEKLDVFSVAIGSPDSDRVKDHPVFSRSSTVHGTPAPSFRSVKTNFRDRIMSIVASTGRDLTPQELLEAFETYWSEISVKTPEPSVGSQFTTQR